MTNAAGSPVDAAGSVLILDDDELVGIPIETVARLAGMAARRVPSHGAFFAAVVAAAASPCLG